MQHFPVQQGRFKIKTSSLKRKSDKILLQKVKVLKDFPIAGLKLR